MRFKTTRMTPGEWFSNSLLTLNREDYRGAWGGARVTGGGCVSHRAWLACHAALSADSRWVRPRMADINEVVNRV